MHTSVTKKGKRHEKRRGELLTVIEVYGDGRVGTTRTRLARPLETKDNLRVAVALATLAHTLHKGVTPAVTAEVPEHQSVTSSVTDEGAAVTEYATEFLRRVQEAPKVDYDSEEDLQEASERHLRRLQDYDLDLPEPGTCTACGIEARPHSACRAPGCTCRCNWSEP